MYLHFRLGEFKEHQATFRPILPKERRVVRKLRVSSPSTKTRPVAERIIEDLMSFLMSDQHLRYREQEHRKAAYSGAYDSGIGLL
jgi:hypothetical protein